MKVHVKVQPLGLYNGRPLNVKRGDVADLPDEYAAGLIAGGLAEPAEIVGEHGPEKPKTTRGRRRAAKKDEPAETATAKDPDEQTATPDEAGEKRPDETADVEKRA